jgi:hypothetical protein
MRPPSQRPSAGHGGAPGDGVYSILRNNTYDAVKLDRGRKEMAKFNELQAQQPGFLDAHVAT